MTARARIAIVLLAALWCSAAHAQTLQEGQSAWMNADFRRAGQIFERLLESPDADRETIVQAHLHLAAIALLGRDRSAAASHARLAIALDANAQPPDGAPDELGPIFERARREGGGAASLSLTTERDGSAATLSATLSNSPTGLVDSLLVRCRGEGSLRAEETGPPPSVSLHVARAEDTPRCEAHALNRYRVSLIDATLDLAPASGRAASSSGPLAPAEATAPAHGDDTLLWVLVTVGIVIAVAAAVTIPLVVVTSSSPQDPSIGGFVVHGW